MEYIIILVLIGLVYFQWRKNRGQYEEEAFKKIVVVDEFKKTIALGLYQRFCKEIEEKKYSATFLKSDPLDFRILSQML